MANLLQTVQEKMVTNTNRTCFVCQNCSFSDVLEGPETEPTGLGQTYLISVCDYCGLVLKQDVYNILQW